MKRILTTVILVWLASPGTARAHKGPPFPVLMDEPIPGYSVSAWADPDIGTGTFYIVTDPRGGETEAPHVELWAQPVSKRLPKVTYPAEREDLGDSIEFVALPEFDQQEMWTVGIVVQPAHGDASELTVEVEATPPGIGPWGLVIYLVPFLLFGGLWIMGMKRRRGMVRAANSQSEPRHIRTAGE